MKNIVKPVVTTVENVLAEVDITYSTGYNVSGTPSVFCFNAQIGMSMDTKGNIAIQASVGGGITTGSPSISFSRYKSRTIVSSINELEGDYSQMGASIATLVGEVPVYVGKDIMGIRDKNRNANRFGFTDNIGFGTPGKEIHAEWGRTYTIPYTQVNVFKAARLIYKRIMEW